MIILTALPEITNSQLFASSKTYVLRIYFNYNLSRCSSSQQQSIRPSNRNAC